jgi:hypothetical protein
VASFDEVIPPGKVGTIRASIHTANLKGPIGKSITVTHDDASQQAIVLGVTAKVVGSVDVFPFAALQLARHRRGFENPAKLLLRKDATEKGTLAVGGVVASASWLKVSARKVDAAEPPVDGIPAAQPGDFVLSVQAEAAPSGSHAENVTLKTGLPREPKLTIPVTVSVQPAVTLQPAALSLAPPADAKEGATGQVLASIREDLDPKTLSFRSDDPAFVVRADPPGERAFRLIVTREGKGSKPADATTVHIKVGAETVDLPVRIERGGAPKAP